MPTYEYICNACQHEWECFQRMTAEPIKECPECGKKKAERQMGSGLGVIFKGTGFYETDYRSESYSKDAAADKKSSEPASSEKSDSNSKTESTSAASSESKSSSKSSSSSSDSSSSASSD